MTGGGHTEKLITFTLKTSFGGPALFGSVYI